MTPEQMIGIVARIDEGGLTEFERDALIGLLIDATPHAKISDLIFLANPELSPAEIVEEALRREAAWRREHRD